jgi:hypothetical protein
VNGADLEAGTEVDGTEVVVEGEPGASGGAAPAEVVDPGVKALQEQLDAEKRRREAAEREAEALRTERGRDQKAVVDSRLLVIDSTIQTNETKKASILSRIREAKEAGDIDAELAATDELSQVNIDLKQAKLGKERLEQQIEEAGEPQSEGDKFEAWADQNRIHPKSRAWLREHMDYVTDSYKNAELTLAHQKAVRAGLALNTPEYFEAIETNLGLRGGSEEQGETEEETEVRGGVSALAAPVSRAAPPSRQSVSVPGITVLGPGKYKVTKEIAEAAAMSGISTKEYVEQALKLQRGPDGQLH